MTTREEIRERIDQIDDAALPDLLEQIDRFERRRRDLSLEFFEALDAVHERNRDLSDEDALKLATDAVKWATQTRDPDYPSKR